MSRRTFVAPATDLGIDGEILITIYDTTVTIALRETGARTWGPPIIAEERP